MSSVICLLHLVLLGFWVGVPPQEAKPAEPASVDSLVQDALQAYKEGRADDAVELLNKAIGVIQEGQQKGLATFMPEPPKGWKADEIEKSSASFGSSGQSQQWIQVTRRYYPDKEGSDLHVEITLTNSPQLIQVQEAASQIYRNPQMLQLMNQDPNKKIEVFDQAPWFGWRIIEKGDSANGIAYCKSRMVTVNVSQGDQAALDLFWKAIDFKKMATK